MMAMRVRVVMQRIGELIAGVFTVFCHVCTLNFSNHNSSCQIYNMYRLFLFK